MGAITLAAATAVLAGCGDSAKPASTTPAAAPVVAPPAITTTTTTTAAPKPKKKPVKKKPASGAAKFTGQDRSNYTDAKATCGAFPPAKVASDLGLRGNRGQTADELGDIALKFSKTYSPAFRQAVFEGCLAGLPNASG